jgi:hypothetical protein
MKVKGEGKGSLISPLQTKDASSSEVARKLGPIKRG